MPELPDTLKNDYQNAMKRNLHTWTQWRTQLNNSLADAVMTGSQVRGVQPIADCLNSDVSDPYHPTTNPKTLMSYSASANSETNLRRRYFYKYGIPRAKVLTPKVTLDNRMTQSSLQLSDIDHMPSYMGGDESVTDGMSLYTGHQSVKHFQPRFHHDERTVRGGHGYRVPPFSGTLMRNPTGGISVRH